MKIDDLVEYMLVLYDSTKLFYIIGTHKSLREWLSVIAKDIVGYALKSQLQEVGKFWDHLRWGAGIDGAGAQLRSRKQWLLTSCDGAQACVAPGRRPTGQIRFCADFVEKFVSENI
ncbi:hypothetical protein P8452_12522 [Trifolium repens]|nr:hypothetical protein P8452_12522 [Trifolium repens]